MRDNCGVELEDLRLAVYGSFTAGERPPEVADAKIPFASEASGR